MVSGASVNGETAVHNLIGANSRFNGTVEAEGTMTAIRNSTTVRGGIKADENLRVLTKVGLTVRGELEGEKITVAQNTTLVVGGELNTDRLVRETGVTSGLRVASTVTTPA